MIWKNIRVMNWTYTLYEWWWPRRGVDIVQPSLSKAAVSVGPTQWYKIPNLALSYSVYSWVDRWASPSESLSTCKEKEDVKNNQIHQTVSFSVFCLCKTKKTKKARPCLLVNKSILVSFCCANCDDGRRRNRETLLDQVSKRHRFRSLHPFLPLLGLRSLASPDLS